MPEINTQTILQRRGLPEGTELRTFKVEVRKEDDGPQKIVGYAAKFDQPSNLLFGYFTEIIRSGAFTKALNSSDVRCLRNHNDDFLPLGRTKNGTLVLRQDDTGLYFEATPPDTQEARDLMKSIERGDIDQMSFAFGDVTDRVTDDGENVTRELLEIRKLYDVSPVTYPAYEDTEVFVRGMRLGTDEAEAERSALRKRLGDERTDPNPTEEATADETDPAPAGVDDSDEGSGESDPAPAGRRDNARWNRLKLAEAA